MENNDEKIHKIYLKTKIIECPHCKKDIRIDVVATEKKLIRYKKFILTLLIAHNRLK